jgi:hypothetical protein
MKLWGLNSRLCGEKSQVELSELWHRLYQHIHIYSRRSSTRMVCEGLCRTCNTAYCTDTPWLRCRSTATAIAIHIHALWHPGTRESDFPFPDISFPLNASTSRAVVPLMFQQFSPQVLPCQNRRILCDGTPCYMLMVCSFREGLRLEVVLRIVKDRTDWVRAAAKLVFERHLIRISENWIQFHRDITQSSLGHVAILYCKLMNTSLLPWLWHDITAA